MRNPLVQGRMTPNTTSNETITTLKLRFHRKTKASNAYAFGITWGSSSATITSVQDDKGNNWTGRTAVQDGGNNQSAQLWYLNNGTAGAKEVTIVFSAGQTFVGVLGPYEFSDIDTSGSPFDGTGARRTTSGASITSGSFTTTGRALVIQMVFLDSFPSQTTRATWTRQGEYKFLSPDGCGFSCAQFSVQEGGAQNPTAGLSFSATSAMSMTEAFKISEGAGSPRDAFGVVRMHYQMFPCNINGAIVDKTTWDYQCPCEAGYLLLGIQTKNNNTVASIRDSKGNIYAACGSASKDPINDHVVEHWGAVISAPDEDLVVSITWGSATGGTPSSSPTVYFREIVGADKVNPVAQTANSNGTSGATSGNITGATLSAPAAGGLIAGFQQEDGETITSVTNANATMSAPDTGQYSTDGAEKDGGTMDDYSSDGSSYTVTWVYSNYEGATTINKHVDQLVSIRANPVTNPAARVAPPSIVNLLHAPSGWASEVNSSKAWF